MLNHLKKNKNILNISSINLGCAKNLVDTQYFLWKIFSDSVFDINYFSDAFDEEVEFVILNTCWFISSARQEMFDFIEILINAKKKILLFGCGIEYFFKVDKKIPEILKHKNIKFLSWSDLKNTNIEKILNWFNSTIFWNFEFSNNPIAYTNEIFNFEYVKIAEWCNNSCSYCLIPKIRGKQISLPIENIIEQVKNLINNWIQEIILISQDSSRYWIDIYKKPYLIKLLQEIDKIDWDFNYRVLYLYPDILTYKILQDLKQLNKFIPYFDIPLQHISPNVLKNMKRFNEVDKIKDFLNLIRKSFQKSFIRTNFIIWFPMETAQDFELLLDFVKSTDFDNIALFEYHDEPFTDSFKLDNKIDYKTIHKRFEIIKKIIDKKLKDKQSNRKNSTQIWFIMDINQNKKNPIIVRPFLNSPEIDFYDEINLNQIVESKNWIIDIWSKIKYII